MQSHLPASEGGPYHRHIPGYSEMYAQISRFPAPLLIKRRGRIVELLAMVDLRWQLWMHLVTSAYIKKKKVRAPPPCVPFWPSGTSAKFCKHGNT